MNTTSVKNIKRRKVPPNETHINYKCKKIDVLNDDYIRQTRDHVESTTCSEKFVFFFKLDAACCQDSNKVDVDKVIVHTNEFEILNEDADGNETIEDSNGNKEVPLCNLDKWKVTSIDEEGTSLINDCFIEKEAQ